MRVSLIIAKPRSEVGTSGLWRAVGIAIDRDRQVLGAGRRRPSRARAAGDARLRSSGMPAARSRMNRISRAIGSVPARRGRRSPSLAPLAGTGTSHLRRSELTCSPGTFSLTTR